jgi:hypothetical protein
MILIFLIATGFAQDGLSDVLQKMLISSECIISQTTYIRVSYAGNNPNIIEATPELPSCAVDVINVMPYPDLNNKHIIITINPEKTEINATMLPVTTLHYFYENPELTSEQRLQLALYLGVINE